MSADALTTPSSANPEAVYNCPSCGHWLPEGTLACPDCQTLAYGQHLGSLAGQAHALEQEKKLAEARVLWVQALAWIPENTAQADSVRQHIGAIDQLLEAEAARTSKWKKRLGPFYPLLLFLIKIKTALFFLFKLKFLISFLAFFGLYWALWGWQFALGITVSILIHEMGHYVEVRRRGLKADLPAFLPGLGAYVRWYHQGISLDGLASIALAGPLYGLFAALACVGLYWGTHLDIFLVLANVGAWINIINLVPFFGLDGAQATYALSQLQRGLIALLCLIFFALTVSLSGGQLFAPQTQWVFSFVAVGMGWRCLFGRDQAEHAHTGTMAYFCGLILALGMVLLFTAGPVLQASQPR